MHTMHYCRKWSSLVVLNITVCREWLINVHPRKSEVKFSDDKIIFKAVYHGILNALNITP